MWKEIKGYKWLYRINEDGLVQRFWKEKWIDRKPHFGEKLKRPKICMRRADNSRVEVPLVNLMADAFMGGRKPGMVIIHKDGMRLNCSVWNLRFVTQQESGRIYGASRNKPVLKIAPDGSVIPCQSWLSDEPLGNLLVDEFKTIWKSSKCKKVRSH